MHHDLQPIDEYTLAAFLADTLSEKRRLEVAAYLAENTDARELLCMAYEAMEAAREPLATPFVPPVAAPVQTPPVHPATPRPAWRFQSIRRYAAAGLLVLVLAIGVRLGLGLRDDAFRGEEPSDRVNLSVHISTPALLLQWTKVPDAYYYRIHILDQEDAQLVAQHETRYTRLDRDDAFLLSLRPRLKTGRLYHVRIDAVDVQNRLILSSELTEFTLEE